MKRLIVGAIRFYQRTLSPLKPAPTCRFYPTCSAYALEAFKNFGLLRASWMSFSRLCKCGPWHPGGYDPVPTRDRL